MSVLEYNEFLEEILKRIKPYLPKKVKKKKPKSFPRWKLHSEGELPSKEALKRLH